jgi:hypothetical protein
MSQPVMSIFAPVAIAPSNFASPENVPVMCQRTATLSPVATRSTTSMRKSGTALNMFANQSRTSSGARSEASPWISSMQPGSQQEAIASGSRAATASK